MSNNEFNKLMDKYADIMKKRITLPKLIVHTSEKCNPDKKIVFASPFDGNKKLHNRICLYVEFLYEDIDCRRDNNCRAVIQIGNSILVEDIIPMDKVESKIIEYNEMLLEVVSDFEAT